MKLKDLQLNHKWGNFLQYTKNGMWHRDNNDPSYGLGWKEYKDVNRINNKYNLAQKHLSDSVKQTLIDLKLVDEEIIPVRYEKDKTTYERPLYVITKVNDIKRYFNKLKKGLFVKLSDTTCDGCGFEGDFSDAARFYDFESPYIYEIININNETHEITCKRVN
jgi:hypothetical protein